MFSKAIPAPVAALLKDVYRWPIPACTYMAGGTAVAIYLSHRLSLDIDLFTSEEFYCGPLVVYLKQKYTTTVTNPAEKNTLTAIIDNTRFSLFYYPYALLKPLINNPDYRIKLASPEDIATMKVVAIVQRGTAKDFFDLKSLIEAYELSLDYLMSLVQKKYGVSEDYCYQIKRSLVYFDDAVKSLGDVTIVSHGQGMRLKREDWNEVEYFFKKLVLGR
ncbi:MAG TPA: nucleotidyl transferase AbiEii/AbiGii toxin family protein [Candidatus Brocadiaceae bacterium]